MKKNAEGKFSEPVSSGFLLQLISGWLVESSQVGHMDTVPFSFAFRAIKCEFVININRCLGGIEDITTREVVESLADELIHLISDRASFTLFRELQEFNRNFEKKGDLAHEQEIHGIAETYRCFLERLQQEGWNRICLQSPVLMDVIAATYNGFSHSIVRLLSEFREDRCAIQDELLFGSNALIEAMSSAKSDTHDGGCAVRILQLQGGIKIVYKPRSLLGEKLYFHAVEFANTSGAPVRIRAAKVLDRETHGWMEFIAEQACLDKAEVSVYFNITGAISALLFVLGAIDMHEENLVPTRHGPVAVDLECILQPHLNLLRTHRAEAAWAKSIHERIAKSALRVGLIEGYRYADADNKSLVGALLHPEEIEVKRIRWENIGRLTMFPRIDFQTVLQASALPEMAGVKVPMPGHERAFLSSFQAMCEFIFGVRIELEHHVRSFLSLHTGELRIVLRPTQYYGLLRNRLLDHRRWGSAEVWSELAAHSASLPLFEDPNSNTVVSSEEQDCLLRLDFPRFTFSTSESESFRRHGGDLSDILPHAASSALEQMSERLNSLDHGGVSDQCNLLKNAIISSPSYVREKPVFGGAWPACEVASVGTKSEAVSEIFLEESGRILDLVRSAAVDEGGCLFWNGLGIEFGRAGNGLGAIGPNIYDGNIGIGVFAASHYAAVRKESSADLCMRALEPVLGMLRSRKVSIFGHIGLGALSGLGGILYSLCAISQSLESDELLDTAVEMANAPVPHKMLSSRPLDFSGGALGYLLGLLRIFEATGEGSVFRRAGDVATFLVQHLNECVYSDGGWIPSKRPDLCGLSHGLSGMAFVLGAAAQRLKIDELKTFADLCLETEREFYDPVLSCWPDRRTKGRASNQVPGSRWCHGAAGIGLARLEIMKLGAHPPLVSADLEAAVKIVEREQVIGNDSLCCGNFGGVLFLQAVGGLDQFSSAVELGTNRALARIRLARSVGSYAWPAGFDSLNVGLFSGLSGVGLALLRLAKASSVADPLTFGLPRPAFAS